MDRFYFNCGGVEKIISKYIQFCNLYIIKIINNYTKYRIFQDPKIDVENLKKYWFNIGLIGI